MKQTQKGFTIVELVVVVIVVAAIIVIGGTAVHFVAKLW